MPGLSGTNTPLPGRHSRPALAPRSAAAPLEKLEGGASPRAALPLAAAPRRLLPLVPPGSPPAPPPPADWPRSLLPSSSASFAWRTGARTCGAGCSLAGGRVRPPRGEQHVVSAGGGGGGTRRSRSAPGRGGGHAPGTAVLWCGVGVWCVGGGVGRRQPWRGVGAIGAVVVFGSEAGWVAGGALAAIHSGSLGCRLTHVHLTASRGAASKTRHPAKRFGAEVPPSPSAIRAYRPRAERGRSSSGSYERRSGGA